MEIKISINCKCGNYEYIPLKRTVNMIPDTGRVYENYSSITDSYFKNFKVDQSQPDTIHIECLQCGEKQELTT